jgi:hypothetical protein
MATGKLMAPPGGGRGQTAQLGFRPGPGPGGEVSLAPLSILNSTARYSPRRTTLTSGSK